MPKLFGPTFDERLSLPKNNRVVICTPYMTPPPQAYVDSLLASDVLLKERGYEPSAIFEIGNAYISYARMILLRKALDVSPKFIVFIDYDLEWEAEGLLKLIETEGDVVAGNYRYKQEEEEYMATLIPGPPGADGVQRPIERADGCVLAHAAPAGFLKVTPDAVNRFMNRYPERIVQPFWRPSVDMFHQGAKDGTWWGEDFAFSRDWRNMGEMLWIVPDLNLTHHDAERGHPGNYRQFLLRQPGGSEAIGVRADLPPTQSS